MKTKGVLVSVTTGVLAFLIASTGLAGNAFAKDEAKSTEIKLATLAPKGSAWAKILEKGAKDIDTKTEGRVKIKWFFGGSQGDEREAVRKMKLGHLQGAAITAVGMGLIKSDVRVLELPFMFKNDKELDYVREKMAADFEAQFDTAGYVLLAWGDVGWTHVYANLDIQSKEDLKKTKMWAWTDDPIVKAFFKRLGVNGVPLGVPDVLPSLQTGLIDGCYGAPLAAVALQWYTKIKFATSIPISYSIGAMIVKKEDFNKLSADDQKTIRELSKAMGEDLMKTVRKDNERAKKAMEKQGIKFTTTPAALVSDFEKEGKGVWDDLAGDLYSKDLLTKVKKYVEEARK
jgi:TRAP-type transport system periplasmic protein